MSSVRQCLLKIHPQPSSLREAARAFSVPTTPLVVSGLLAECDRWSAVYRTPLTVAIYNTALFPEVLAGVVPYPLYTGFNRLAAIRGFTENLLACGADVVGLTECWVAEDRDTIATGVASQLPYRLDGYDLESGWLQTEHFGSGLMLLSRHPISDTHTTIYRQAIGEDAYANKGALHARVTVPGHPAPYDVFLTHMQAEPEFASLGNVGKGDTFADKHAYQVAHLRSFVHAYSDSERPAYLMGDFNIDAIVDGHVATSLLIDATHVLVDAWGAAPGYAVGSHDEVAANPFGVTSGPGNYSSDAQGASLPVTTVARWLTPAGGPAGKRLDHVYFRRGARYDATLSETTVLAWQVTEVTGGPLPGAYARLIDVSDHYGVAVYQTALREYAEGSTGQLKVRLHIRELRCLNGTDEVTNDEIRVSLKVTVGGSLIYQVQTDEVGSLNSGSWHQFPENGNAVILQLPAEGVVIEAFVTEMGGGGNSISSTGVLYLSQFALTRFQGIATAVIPPLHVFKNKHTSGEYAVTIGVEVSPD